MIKEKLFEMCIRFLERDLLNIAVETLNQEQSEGLFSMLWDNAAFRNYVKERDKTIVYALAGRAGTEPLPRDKTRLLLGQRFENLVLARKAKTAAMKRDKARALKREAK